METTMTTTETSLLLLLCPHLTFMNLMAHTDNLTTDLAMEDMDLLAMALLAMEVMDLLAMDPLDLEDTDHQDMDHQDMDHQDTDLALEDTEEAMALLDLEDMALLDLEAMDHQDLEDMDHQDTECILIICTFFNCNNLAMDLEWEDTVLDREIIISDNLMDLLDLLDLEDYLEDLEDHLEAEDLEDLNLNLEAKALEDKDIDLLPTFTNSETTTSSRWIFLDIAAITSRPSFMETSSSSSLSPLLEPSTSTSTREATLDKDPFRESSTCLKMFKLDKSMPR